jgi:hypothetical protein
MRITSARKLKRGHANLLGGRALRYELYGLSAIELGDDFDLERILNVGSLPRIYSSSRPRPLINAYVAEYLKEEVLAEGLVRLLPPFSNFLNAAALSDGEQINYIRPDLTFLARLLRTGYCMSCDATTPIANVSHSLASGVFPVASKLTL